MIRSSSSTPPSPCRRIAATILLLFTVVGMTLLNVTIDVVVDRWNFVDDHVAATGSRVGDMAATTTMITTMVVTASSDCTSAANRRHSTMRPGHIYCDQRPQLLPSEHQLYNDNRRDLLLSTTTTAAAVAFSTSPPPSLWSSLLKANDIPRGGSNNDDNNDGQSSTDDDGDGEGDDDLTSDHRHGLKKNKIKRRFSSFALTSPFQMYEAAREEASEVLSDIKAETISHKESENDNGEKQNNGDPGAGVSYNYDRNNDKKKGRKKKRNRGIQAETLVGGAGTAALVHDEEQHDVGDVDDPYASGEETNGEDLKLRLNSDTEIPDSDTSSPSSQPQLSSSNGSKFWWANLWSDIMDDDESSSSEDEGEREQEDGGGSDSDGNGGADEDQESQVDRDTNETIPCESTMDDANNDTVKSDRTEKDDCILKDTDSFLDVRDDTGIITVGSTGGESSKEQEMESTGDGEKAVVYADESPSFVSSGAWVPIDNLLSLGLASRYSAFRISRSLRGVRKMSARVTGLHGVLSGKPAPSIVEVETTLTTVNMTDYEDTARQKIIRKRIAAIDRAREKVRQASATDDENFHRRRKGLFGGLFRRNEIEFDQSRQDSDTEACNDGTSDKHAEKVPQKTLEEIQDEQRRMERVREIDRLIQEGQTRLQTLICEKDVLQRRPNPLFEYTTTETVTTEMKSNKIDGNITDESSIEDAADAAATSSRTMLEVQASRKMIFPPEDLVDDYLDMMLSTGRLIKMNHTYLWQDETEDDDEETIGDDLFTPSANARTLYQDANTGRWKDKGNGGSGGGSWLLRQSIGSGPTLGEKIGEAAETAAYKAVCKALMSFLARLLSSLHGINVLKHSDIRLVLEQVPDLPPWRNDDIFSASGTNYAEETIKSVMRRKTRKSRAGSRRRFSSDDSFVQRDAVTEMLLSHVQISAPLLKLFPLAWQRALLGNIITLSTAVISDFLDGLSFQILGHQLSFAFRPITEEDLVQQIRLAGGRFNHRRYKPAEFEAAVHATAEDVSEGLKFLDKWHERALGSGVLRTQIANMIARIVLTLTDEILSGARMDLWSSQANGPRILAGLEYRIEADEI